MIKTRLNDAGLNVLLNFLDRGVSTLTLTSNCLTEDSLAMVLNCVESGKSYKLKNLYLGQNFVPKGYKQLASLRAAGINVFV